MAKSVPKLLLFVALYLIFSSCVFTDRNSTSFCEGQNCFIVEQNSPFIDEGKSGIYFIYGKKKNENNFVHVRYTDAPFYYRWDADTLILRCPFWKVVENNVGANKLFDFKDEFTAEEKAKYGYDVDVKQFYKNISKDFKEVNTYQLK